jgi:transcriptional regulator with XRE-family HTH domain
MKLDLSFIGKNIRELRQQRNWSMAKLATRVGMNEVPLGRIERGLNAPLQHLSFTGFQKNWAYRLIRFLQRMNINFAL